MGTPNPIYNEFSGPTLNGFFKDIYADKLGQLIPEGVKLSKMIGFVPPAKRLGSTYKQPIALSLEHGVTFGGSEGLAFDITNSVAGATREASVQGYEMVMRGRVSIGAISRSSANPSASFGRATKHVINNLFTSSYKKHETQMFYGQEALAKVTTVGALVGVSTVTIDDAEWASGIWAGAEGMRLAIFSDSEDLGAGAVLGGGDSGTVYSVTGVDIDNKQITVSPAITTTGAGFIELYEHGSILGTTTLANKGDSAQYRVMIGLHKMLTNTTASMFGIPAANYSLWKGNQYDVGGVDQLSFKHISKGISKAVAKGVEGKITLIVNPEVWADLLDAQTSKRSFDSSYGSAEYKEGSEKITFYSQNGVVEIIASTYCKLGYAYGLNLPMFSRVGSSDITFKLPGTKEDFVIKPENAHAIEFRTYCDVALFCEAIGQNIVFSNFAV